MGSTTEEIDLHSREVCPAYCVDFCVFSLLPQLGHCTRKHIERARMLYEKEGPLPEFEDYFSRQLDMAISRLNETLAENEEKLTASTDPSLERELIEVYQESGKVEEYIELIEHEIKLFGNAGMIRESLRDLSLLREFEIKKSQLERKINVLHDKVDFSSPQKFQSCLICGALLGAGDTDEHLAQHFKGRSHQGYATVRRTWFSRHGSEKLPELPKLPALSS